MGVLRTIPVGIIITFLQVDIIQASFVRAHISLAKNIEPPRAHLVRHVRADGRINNLIAAAGGQDRNRRQNTDRYADKIQIS